MFDIEFTKIFTGHGLLVNISDLLPDHCFANSVCYVDTVLQSRVGDIRVYAITEKPDLLLVRHHQERTRENIVQIRYFIHL